MREHLSVLSDREQTGLVAHFPHVRQRHMATAHLRFLVAFETVFVCRHNGDHR